MASGVVFAYYRFFHGYASVTNLNKAYPYGIWIACDVAFGVALAAGGFTTAAIVEIFGRGKYQALVRPAILTALNAPVDWLLGKADGFCRKTMAFFVIAGVVLSFGHQRSLGTMMLIAHYMLHELWYTPLSPLLFLTSAVSVGIPMVVFEGTLAAKFFGRKPEIELLSGIAKYIPLFLGTYLLLRIGDLAYRGVLASAFDGSLQGNAFLLEFALFAVPYFVLKRRRSRQNPTLLFLCSLSVICAVVLNRFNVFLIGMDMGPEYSYFPSVGEWAITFAFLSFGVLLYKIGVNYLPILEEEH